VIDPKEYESPVLGGLKPKFTKVSFLKTSISSDGKTAKIHYDVQTKLGNFEVTGGWIAGLFNGIWQDNIITVTQSVDIELKIGSISTTFDGSTFPESRYNASYTVNTGTEVLTGANSTTLHQSTYKDAVHTKTFKAKGHPEKNTKTLTY
jgi:hypothetical protein